MVKWGFSLGFSFFFLLLASQTKKVETYRIQEKIKIDGILEEASWKDKDFATGFIEFQPNNGQTEKTNSPTQVKILYDDTSLYFGFELKESKMDSLNTRLSNRDDISNSEDWVLVAINPFNDQQQYFEFGVSAAGVQFDAFATQSSGEDWSWNAIWDSAVNIEGDHWQVEIQLPYSALRFPKEFDENWSINFIRNYSKNRKKFSWVHIDNQKGNFFQYTGNLHGLQGITPPTRLFFIPYASDYVTHVNGVTQNTLRGGMDLNWGINESYTLDAVLIPDFGQTDFDAVEYVLGPFEQQFSDKRPFFTEGVDLLSKGDLLYSRRIGQAPSFYPELSMDETITEYPNETQLLNALKVSGRGKNGLGIGLLNAITDTEEAQIYNTQTGESRTAVVSPFTNYNVLVLDKRLKESASSLSLVNTNTTRNGHFRDANATALIADMYDKENKYNYYARTRFDFINDTQNSSGFDVTAAWNKQFGKYRYGIGGSYTSKNFDINDLGINFYKNYFDWFLYGNYRILESNKKFNSLFIGNGLESRWDNTTGKPYYIDYYFNFNSTNKKNNYNGFGFNISPFTTYNFYEPRQAGRYSENPKGMSFWYYNSPNYAKKFLIDKNIFGAIGSFKDAYSLGASLAPRYRPSDHLLVEFEVSYNYDSKERGFVDSYDNQILYGARDRQTLTTNITGEYYFNPKTSLALNFRHYYTNAAYKEFYNLNENGSYTENHNYDINKDFTFNTWNMDLRFSWWFAPGSQMEILYRNTLDSYTDVAENNLGNNFQYLFDQPLTQIFSVRVTYFFDFNKAKAFFKGHSKNRNEEQKAYINGRIEKYKSQLH